MNAPMLTLTGKVTNVFEAPKGTNKEGKEYGGGDKVQLLVQNPLQNGETRMDVVTLATDQADFFRAREGQQVRLPVGAFPSGKAVQFFVLKGVPLDQFNSHQGGTSGGAESGGTPLAGSAGSAARRLVGADS